MVRLANHTIAFSNMTNDPIKIIANKARICYQSNEYSKKSDIELCKSLLKNNHIAMFDHAFASFDIITNIGVTREIERHRIGVGYAELSTRYCNFSKDRFGNQITVVPSISIKDVDMIDYIKKMEVYESNYFDMLNKGYKPEIAREFLPLATKTELGITATFTAWFHFFKLRCDISAHPDTRHVMNMILDNIKSQSTELNELFSYARELDIC